MFWHYFEMLGKPLEYVVSITSLARSEDTIEDGPSLRDVFDDRIKSISLDLVGIDQSAVEVEDRATDHLSVVNSASRFSRYQ